MPDKLYIEEETRKTVVSYCNKKIVPSSEYIENPDGNHPIEWFKTYFSFVSYNSLVLHLADAYYQARFLYKIMQGLRLTSFKRAGVLKFQIQQYASIYEALIDYVLETCHKDKLPELLKEIEYRPVNVLSKDASLSIIIDGKQEDVVTCKKTFRKVALKQTRIDKRTKIAADLGIISGTVKDEFDGLYDLRNNIHILKAASANYKLSVAEATRAFQLMDSFVSSVKIHLHAHNASKTNDIK